MLPVSNTSRDHESWRQNHICFSFSPEYLQNFALPSQVVLGREKNKKSDEKWSPKDNSEKAFHGKCILYFDSPSVWTVLWSEIHRLYVKCKFYYQLLERLGTM